MAFNLQRAVDTERLRAVHVFEAIADMAFFLRNRRQFLTAVNILPAFLVRFHNEIPWAYQPEIWSVPYVLIQFYRMYL